MIDAILNDTEDMLNSWGHDANFDEVRTILDNEEGASSILDHFEGF
jgi:hypothetical protein